MPGGVALLVNGSPSPVRVWATANWWGDTTLSFEVVSAGVARRVERREQEYTVNVPASIELASGGVQEFPFDLGDGEWRAGVPLEGLFARSVELVAVYDVPPTREAIDQGMWTGQLRSAPIRVGQ